MQYRHDGKSNRELSALGFGCMRFPRKGSGIDFSRSSKMLYSAIEKGVNYLDTAYIYGGSEAFLGQALTPEWREKVSIATKLPLFMVKSGADFDKYFNRSLERLKTDHVEYYLAHMLTSLDLWEKLCSWGIEEWIEKQKQSGRIGAIGFSYHGGRLEFPKILKAYPWDFCQIQYNYLDENNQAGRSGLELAESMGIPVIVMEPLRGGNLARNLPKPVVDEFNKAVPGRTPADWAFKWVWNHPGVTCVLSGMSGEDEIEENIRLAAESGQNVLTDAEIAVYENVVKLFGGMVKVPCTACGYCLPCPKGVDIPTSFSSYNTAFSLGKSKAHREYMQNIDALHTDEHYASKCVNCGKCESHCPQNIQIRKELSNAAKLLEPWWFGAGMKMARTVLGFGKKNVKNKSRL
ncbi:MAG: aldo/keto reductase [Oscillospiraceae bacterium]|nr:aldo/keto reductase [Oscillospiraceae bacterium]